MSTAAPPSSSAEMSVDKAIRVQQLEEYVDDAIFGITFIRSMSSADAAVVLLERITLDLPDLREYTFITMPELSMDVFPQPGQKKEDISKHIYAIAASVRVLLARTGPVMQPELLVAATQIIWRLFSRSREIGGDFRLLLDDVGPILCDTVTTLVSLMTPYVLRPMDEWKNIVGSVE